MIDKRASKKQSRLLHVVLLAGVIHSVQQLNTKMFPSRRECQFPTFKLQDLPESRVSNTCLSVCCLYMTHIHRSHVNTAGFTLIFETE